MAPIVELSRRVFDEVYRSRYPEMAADSSKTDAVWLEYSELCRDFLVAEIDGRIVGTVRTADDKICELYVESDMRARGVGAALLAAVERRLRIRGVATCRLDAARDYPEVVAFYERQGWQRQREHSHENSNVPLLEMAKCLQTKWKALAWSATWHSTKLPLIGWLCVITYPAFALVLTTAAAAPRSVEFAWLVMAVLAVWNLLLIPISSFYSWKNVGLIVIGMFANVAAMNIGAAIGFVFRPHWHASAFGYLADATEIVLLLLVVGYFDRIARGFVVGLWIWYGLEVEAWLDRVPKPWTA